MLFLPLINVLSDNFFDKEEVNETFTVVTEEYLGKVVMRQRQIDNEDGTYVIQCSNVPMFQNIQRSFQLNLLSPLS